MMILREVKAPSVVGRAVLRSLAAIGVTQRHGDASVSMGKPMFTEC